MKRFTVVTNPQETALFEIHSTGCAHLAKVKMLYKRGYYSSITEVEAESAKAALAHELNENFSGGSDGSGWEHPPSGGYPGGSYGAAGFEGKILPCTRKAVSA